MIAYYGYTISPNQMETVEGFLICRNVPIARTGEMEYLESELKLEGDSSKVVKVYRSPKEVFSEEALSSFEGKPVTEEHPPDLLTPDTYSIYAKGHAQNVRRGEGKWKEHVVADLHIQDESLIKAIQEGKREISCGYECSYTDNGDGSYSQHHIRGNHIAVVMRGRAGKQVAILDSKKKVETIKQPERKEKMKKNHLFFKLFAKAAKDASAEELETLAADAADVMEDADVLGTEVEKKEEEKKEGKENQDTSSLDSKLDMILQLLGKKEEPEQDKDPLDSLIENLTEGKAATTEAKVVPAEETDQAACAADKAILVEVVKQIRPVIAKIKDSADRKAVTDSLISYITSGEVNEMEKIVQTTKENVAHAKDATSHIDLDACQKAYDAMNPHKNGGKKE